MNKVILIGGLLVSLSATGCATVKPEVFPRKAPVESTNFQEPATYMTTDLPKTRDELRDLIGQTVMDAINQYQAHMEHRQEMIHQPMKGLPMKREG